MTVMHAGPALQLPLRLRIARTAARMDQQQLAAAIGVARNSVSNWERGVSEPTASAFIRLARATGVSLEWLAEGVPDDQDDAADDADAAPSPYDPRPSPAQALWLVAVLLHVALQVRAGVDL